MYGFIHDLEATYCNSKQTFDQGKQNRKLQAAKNAAKRSSICLDFTSDIWAEVEQNVTMRTFGEIQATQLACSENGNVEIAIQIKLQVD